MKWQVQESCWHFGFLRAVQQSFFRANTPSPPCLTVMWSDVGLRHVWQVLVHNKPQQFVVQLTFDSVAVVEELFPHEASFRLNVVYRLLWCVTRWKFNINTHKKCDVCPCAHVTKIYTAAAFVCISRRCPHWMSAHSLEETDFLGYSLQKSIVPEYFQSN